MSEKQTLIAKVTSNNFHIVKGQFLHIFLFVIYNDQKKKETKNKRKINSRLSIGILKLVLFAYSVRFDWMIYLLKKKIQIKFETHSFLWKNDQNETVEWKKWKNNQLIKRIIYLYVRVLCKIYTDTCNRWVVSCVIRCTWLFSIGLQCDSLVRIICMSFHSETFCIEIMEKKNKKRTIKINVAKLKKSVGRHAYFFR